ncbi:MAG TPA: DUF4242 domain-containing protein [Acidimicrobiales bacterium]|nr:DUF4242 domain-containing protein [Acidimicrobiales bacterium]
MPKFMIEREIPGLGSMSPTELREVSQKSNQVLCDLGPQIQWLHSYTTDDKLYCVYIAPDEDIIFEHARCGGFPADKVSQIGQVIDPTTGD